jgi:paraquat-inducible protein B
MGRLGEAALGVDQMARRVGRTSDRVGELIAPESPLVLDLQKSVAEVGRTATSLRQATAGDSTIVRGTEQAMADVSRAARALRDLAEAIEQQPESLLRGRQVTP